MPTSLLSPHSPSVALARASTAERHERAPAAPQAGAATTPSWRSTPWRIYYAQPALWGPAAQWPAELDRLQSLGFQQLLIAPPFAVADGPTADLYAPAAFDRLQAAFSPDGDPDAPAADGLRRLATQCRERGLDLLLDLPLHRVAAGSPLARQLGLDADAAAGLRPDPRRPMTGRASLPWPWAGAAADRAVEQLAAWLRPLHAAGVAGFRCEIVDPLAPPDAGTPPWQSLLTALRVGAPDSAFLAWTPGLTPQQLRALQGAGFDAVFSSLPWWDYRAPWLHEEQARLRPLGDVIAMPEAPYASRLASSEAAHRRALWTSAVLGDGLLLPMGFEHGVRAPLERRGAPPATPWARWREQAPFDLGPELQRATAWIASRGTALRGAAWQPLTGSGAPLTALSRQAPGAAAPLVVAINPSAEHAAALGADRLLSAVGAASLLEPGGPGAQAIDAARMLQLGAAEVRLLDARPAAPVLAKPPKGRSLERRAVEEAMAVPRIAIEAITPQCDGGRFAVRRVVGERVRVEADVWMDGHDELAVALLWRAADATGWNEVRMQHLGNDRWAAEFPLARLGRHAFTIEAWRDAFGTWVHDTEKKRDAGVAMQVDVDEGRLLVEAGAARKGAPALLGKLLKQLGPKPAQDAPPADAAVLSKQLALLLDPATGAAMAQVDAREFATRAAPLPLDAERLAARFAAWYELFPRSQGPDERTHGTFNDVIKQLPRVRDMGFDVLYFPPIHPIGMASRKGPNNTLTPGPDDPGSPYAIGSPDGGHDAIHPQLGTLEDFRRLRDAAAQHGLELALDFAVQCSPDHPWLKEHPEWFAFRADGTLRYAENPPKKYQDITNVDFYNATDAPALWLALRDVLLFWCREGIRMFRVDNPHTKPLPFWEWVIADVKGRHPDAMFLAEAFTRPKMMARLAKVGFSQSYSYFTWRNTKHELTEYMTELTTPPLADYYRPHFFVNTPDINPYFLQRSGRPGFLIRAALATTLSGLWGMYSGFEVCDGRPFVVGGIAKEEYADSEKYQLRKWDWSQPGNIVAEITRLNAIRRDNPALHSTLGLSFLGASDDNILYYAKATRNADGRFGDNVLLVAVNLDPHHAHEAAIELPLWQWGLPDDAALDAEELMQGHRFTWRGKHQQVRLDPHTQPFAIWRVRPA